MCSLCFFSDLSLHVYRGGGISVLCGLLRTCLKGDSHCVRISHYTDVVCFFKDICIVALLSCDHVLCCRSAVRSSESLSGL